MQLVLALLVGLASAALAAKCPNFPTVECREPNNCRKHAKDWDLQALPLSGYVVFEISVPQFRRQRTKEVVIGLFGSIVPNAAYNFAQLAAGGIKRGSTVYRYEGTPLHRIKRDSFIVGGDVLSRNGSGAIASVAPDNFFISNYGKGWVGMKEQGAATNHSIGEQFFISLTNDRKALAGFNKQPILNLGVVVRGFSLLQRINDKADKSWGSGKIPLDKSLDPIFKVPLYRPKQDILISKSSFLTLDEGAAKGYPKHAFNRPAEGCLSGRWPRE